jgi:hypothetical protein
MVDLRPVAADRQDVSRAIRNAYCSRSTGVENHPARGPRSAWSTSMEVAWFICEALGPFGLVVSIGCIAMSIALVLRSRAPTVRGMPNARRVGSPWDSPRSIITCFGQLGVPLVPFLVLVGMGALRPYHGEPLLFATCVAWSIIIVPVALGVFLVIVSSERRVPISLCAVAAFQFACQLLYVLMVAGT